MIKCWPLLFISTLSMNVFAQSMNDQRSGKASYDYVNLGFSSGSFNPEYGDSTNVSSLTLGLSHQFADHWLILADYNARYIHPDDASVQLDILTVGGGYRFPLQDNLDIVAAYKLGATKAKSELDHSSITNSSDTEFIQAGYIGLNYAMTSRWFSTASVQFNSSDLLDENIYSIELRYFMSQRFSLGGSYTYRDAKGQTTNEGGVSLQFDY
ncbi:hypothetical protein BCU68_00610 [Vibrio sp. 10N.286.49.B3]|uniref:outer membrane beta-barrel protein n=1 Tax=Vibrio sp. 10N.286.49.B3 TaxID=1880855 RepID=UPI000C867C10|nr:outer membrane beta-barrel protein [Vibrio sp. 10N.286.49.B3]PMH46582.1 hypothetical protein BCU68_00610 [Vibrio sp. 10N.286.49.B3]